MSNPILTSKVGGYTYWATMHKAARRERFDFISGGREEAWGIHLTGTGQRLEPPALSYHVPEPRAPHPWNKGRILPDYAFVYLTTGEGIFAHDQQKSPVQAGDVLVLFPGVWHNYHPLPETGWTEHWTTFNGRLTRHWQEQGLLRKGDPILRVGVRPDVIQCFDRLRELAQENQPYTNQIQSGILVQILGLFLKYQQNRSPGFSESRNLVQKALVLIEKNWRRPIDFAQLAAHLGVSSRQFRRVFQEVTGLPPQQYLIHLRLNEAKKLLETHRIAEVASLIGYPDPFYFSRLFKSKVGVSPKDWC